jgi:hypothetical protein
MAIPLRLSTASQEVPLGYFVDSGDGNTEETALTIANTDIKIWKNGATTLANKNSGGGTHISNGIYYAVLDATDSNIIGPLVIFVHVAGALAIKVECIVYPAEVFDYLFTAAGTDYMKVDIAQIDGAALNAALAQIGINVVNWKGSGAPNNTGDAYARLGAPAGASIAADIAAVKTDTAAILLDTGTDGVVIPQAQADKVWNTAARTLTALGSGLVAEIWNALTSGMSTAGSIGKKLADWVVGTIDTYTGNTKQTGDAYARLGAPAGASVSADIADLHAHILTALGYIDTEIADILADTNELQTDLTNGGRLDLLIDAIKAKTDLLTLAAIADGVWDEAIAGHLGVGSTGEKLNAAASAGDPWSTALPGAYGAGSAGKIVGDNLNAPVATVDTVVDSIKTVVDDIHNTDLPAVKAVVDDIHNSDLPAVGNMLINIHDVDLAAVKGDTAEALTRIPDAPPGGAGGLPTVDANNHVNGVQDGVELSATAIDAILDEVVEGTLTFRQMLRVFLSALAEKSGGGGTPNLTFRDHADIKNRIAATVDIDGNRTTVVLDGT